MLPVSVNNDVHRFDATTATERPSRSPDLEIGRNQCIELIPNTSVTGAANTKTPSQTMVGPSHNDRHASPVTIDFSRHTVVATVDTLGQVNVGAINFDRSDNSSLEPLAIGLTQSRVVCIWEWFQ